MSEIDVSLRRLGIGLSAFRAVRPISPKARLGDEWLYPRHLAYERVGDLAQHRRRPDVGSAVMESCDVCRDAD